MRISPILTVLSPESWEDTPVLPGVCEGIPVLSVFLEGTTVFTPKEAAGLVATSDPASVGLSSSYTAYTLPLTYPVGVAVPTNLTPPEGVSVGSYGTYTDLVGSGVSVTSPQTTSGKGVGFPYLV